MNRMWLVAVALVAALGGAFVLGGAAVLVGRDFLTARLGEVPFVAGTVEKPEAQEEDAADEEKGIVIVGVREGSPAEAAGLQRGDILLAIDDTETNGIADARAVIADKAAGDSVTLRITRGGAEQSLTATLGEFEEDVFLGIEACGFGSGGFGHVVPAIPGEAGAVITEVVADSPAAQAGLQVDEVITAVNGEALAHPMALGEEIGELAPGDRVTLTVRGADESEREVEVTLGTNPEDETKGYLGIRYEPEFMMGRMWRGEGEPWGAFPPFPGMPDGMIPPLAEGESYSAVVVGEVEAGSAAEDAGLQRGDHITDVNGTPVAELVESERDVSKIFDEYQPGDSVTLTVRRSGESEPLSVTATLGEDEEGNAVLGIQAGLVMTVESEDVPFDGMMPPDLFIPAPDVEPAVPETQA